MKDVSVTPERSGTSVALYIMLDAPSNADAMVVHSTEPHWSMESNLAAPARSLPRWILAKSPDTCTVWFPGTS